MLYAFAPEEEAKPDPAKAPAGAKPSGTTTGAGGAKFDDGTNVPYELEFFSLAPRCPYCAGELESEETVVCLNCGYNRQTRIRPDLKRTIAITSADRFKWRFPAGLCIVGCVALIGLIVYLWLILDAKVSASPIAPPEEAEDAGWVFPLRCWGSIFSLFAIWFMGKFAFYRLIQHPQPPEIVIKK
jgi:hypothetical protein